MDFKTMSTKKLAETLKASHEEMESGRTPEIRAEGERTYRAAKAYLSSLPKR